MVLFKLSYFDTGCPEKRVKKEEKIWFSKTLASHPHNYKQPDQTFKKGCFKKVKTKAWFFKKQYLIILYPGQICQQQTKALQIMP